MLSESRTQYLRSSRVVMRALQLTLLSSLKRFNCTKRARVTRSLIAADGSSIELPVRSLSSIAGTSTCISILSIKGPDKRLRYFCTRAGAHGSAPAFPTQISVVSARAWIIAASSMNSEGKVSEPAPPKWSPSHLQAAGASLPGLNGEIPEAHPKTVRHCEPG